MNFLFLLVTFLCVITSCLAYSRGAPPAVCETLMPGHRETSPDTRTPPYTVSLDKMGENKVRVTIAGDEFKGFILQARSSSDKNKFIAGEFTSNNGVSQTLNCFNGRQNTLTQVNGDQKRRVSTEWTATGSVNEDIIFRATVVKAYNLYWTNVDSRPVRIRNQGTMSGERNIRHGHIYNGCFKSKGCFGMPAACIDRGDCEVLLTYERDPEKGIRFAMHGLIESTEYMAMGLSDDDKMGDDFVTECFRNRSNIGILRHSWNEDKTNIPINQRYVDYEFTSRDGLATCLWTQPYNVNTNGRTYDLANSRYHILLAKGTLENNRLRYHSSRLPSSEAADFTQVEEIAGGGVTNSVKIHGTFMVTGWVGLVSIAILLARHFKNVWEDSTLGGVKIWFALHRAFMITALVFIIIAFIVIFVHNNGWNYQQKNPHAILGCIATCLGLLNPIMALFRPSPDHPKRVIFNWAHWLVGNSAQIIAVITIFFAVSLPATGLRVSFYWVMAVFVIVHLIFHFIYQAQAWTQGKKKSNELSMNEMNGTRANSAQNGGQNTQAKKVTADVFRILLLGIYCIFLLVILIALYSLIAVA